MKTHGVKWRLEQRIKWSAGFFSLMMVLLVLAASPLAKAGRLQQTFDIPAGGVDESLRLFAKQANREIIFPAQLMDRIRTNPIKGEFEARVALELLLKKTSLKISEDKITGAFSVRHQKPQPGREVSAVARETAVLAARSEREPIALNPMFVKGARASDTLAFAQQRAYRRQDMALSQQESADSIRIITSTDRFGNVIDNNIASLLVKQPGVGGESDEGDIYNISIRGMGAGLNSVAIDGTRIPGATTRNSGRAFEIDKVSVDPIESIEIIKASTPDMDGDSIGGTINLRTKSAFDFDNPGVDYTLGANYHYNRERFMPSGSLVYAGVLGKDKRLGVVFSSGFNRTFAPREALKMNYTNARLDRPAPITDFHISDDDIVLDRLGASLKADLKLSPATSLSLNVIYNNFEDELMQRKQRLRGEKGKASSADDMTTIVTGGRYDYILESRTRTMRTFRLSLGGETKRDHYELDYDFNRSGSTGFEKRRDLFLRFNGVNYTVDKAGRPHFPAFALTGGADPSNFDHGLTDSLSRKDYHADDTVTGAQFNVKRLWDGAYVKAGVRYRGQEKAQDRAQDVWKYVGADGVAGTSKATGNDDNLNRFRSGYAGPSVGGRYATPAWPDLDAIHSELQTSPELFLYDAENSALNDVLEDGQASEAIYAAYVQGSLTIGKFTALAGGRVERTCVSATGPWIDETAPDLFSKYGRKITHKAVYVNFFPSVHLTYKLLERTQLRASYSTGIGRPSFDTLMPITEIDQVNNTIEQNNTQLKPQRSANVDISLEYYFQPLGILSAGVFEKRISDYISTSTRTIGHGPDNGFDGNYEGFDFITQANGGWARVKGLELNYQQQFADLPGWLSGFGLSANYTRLLTRGNYGTPFVRDKLNNFTPVLANAGLSYGRKRVAFRIQLNYVGERLTTYSENEADWIFREARLTVDASMKYALTPEVGLFVDAFNVFNEKDFTYMGLKSRPASAQIYGVRLSAGIMGRF